MEKSEVELWICVEKLRQNIEEQDEMIGFMSRKVDDEEDVKEAEIRGHGSKSRATFGRNVEEGSDLGEYCTEFSRIRRIRVSQGLDLVPEACFVERIMERNAAEEDGMVVLYGQRNGIGRDFLPSASIAWMEWLSEWQQVKEIAENVNEAMRELPDANLKPEDLWSNHSKVVLPKPHRNDSSSWRAIQKTCYLMA